jgi:hypothetical protein
VLRPAGVLLLLVLAACGSGSEPTDEQRVEAALLRLSDFPADEGWETQPTATTDPAEADFEVALEECEERLDPTVETRSADRDSDGFVRGDTIQAVSNAAVVAAAEVRDELFGALESMVDCFGTALQDALVAQAGGQLEVAVSEPYSIDVLTDAERTAGNAIQLSIQPDTVFIDVVTVEQGPTLLYAAFLHQGELTFDDEEQILAPAVERLKDL